jgi:hypothetical protein
VANWGSDIHEIVANWMSGKLDVRAPKFLVPPLNKASSQSHMKVMEREIEIERERFSGVMTS